MSCRKRAPTDLVDVRGKSAAKRVLEVAADGPLSPLMVGPPSTDKSMLAAAPAPTAAYCLA